MAYVTAPDFPIKSITWALDRPGQSNASQWTGTRTVVTNPWHGRWTAHVELGTRQDETSFRTLRSFFVRCKGTINAFRIYATAGAQNSNGGVTLSANAAPGDTTVTITGASTSLLDGQFFTLNGQLCCCTADQSGSTLTFEPPLRKAATSGTTVVTSRPYALVYLSDPKWQYGVGSWRRFDTSFDVEEAILETDGAVPEGTGVSPPADTVLPSISGSAVEGQTVTCSTGTWTNSPTSYSYQWKRNGSAIGSATSSSYVLVTADVSQLITCTVTASNAGGSASATTASITPAPLSSPTAVFSMTQLPDAKRIYQRATLSGGGQGKGQGTIPVTISVTSVGSVYARVRASDGTTVLQPPFLVGTVGSTGTQTINVSAVDARLGWFYLDLGDGASTWNSGTTLVGMGALFALGGQSLMQYMIGRNESTHTYSSLSLTPDPNSSVLATYDGTSPAIYLPTVSTMAWQLPGDRSDGTGPNSTGVGQLLNRHIAQLGVNCGAIGHAHGGTALNTWMSGQPDWTQWAAVIARAGGAFEGVHWGQGHSDAQQFCPVQGFKDMLSLLFAQITSVNSFSGYGKYLWTVPSTGAFFASAKEHNRMRQAADQWCTANSAVHVHMYDIASNDTVHENQIGAITMGNEMARASRTYYGLSDGLGPKPLSATRVGTTITVTLSDVGQTAISLVGAPTDHVFVFPQGYNNNFDTANRFPVSVISSPNKTTLTLTLANDPGNGHVLDVYFYYPWVSTANNIYDNRVDDGLSTGRILQANPTAITVAAPTPGSTVNAPPGGFVTQASPMNLTPSSATYATGMTGFGSEFTAGYASGQVVRFPAFTFEFFFKCPTIDGTRQLMAVGLDCYDLIGINPNVLECNRSRNVGATLPTTLVAGNRYHVALVCGPSGVKVYLANVTGGGTNLEFSDSTPYTEWVNGSSTAFYLRSLGGSFAMNGGAIDEAALWCYERYPATTYAAPSAPYTGNETNLVALYHLDGNANSSAPA